MTQTTAGLALIDATGEVLKPLAPAIATWCAVDSRSGAVWYMTEGAGGGEQALWGLDIETEGAQPFLVAALPSEGVDHVEVMHAGASLNARPDHHFQVAAVLNLTGDEPRIEAKLGCSGDMSWHCYDGPTEEDALLPEITTARQAINAASVQNAADLSRLAARGSGRAMWSTSTPASPGPEKLEGVSVENCEVIPERCGKIFPLPGTSLQRVIVNNSQGDFYHEQAWLHDPAAGDFLDPSTGARWSLADADEHLDASFPTRGVVAPGGEAYATGSRIIHFERGVVFEGTTCGWVGGGFPFDEMP